MRWQERRKPLRRFLTNCSTCVGKVICQQSVLPASTAVWASWKRQFSGSRQHTRRQMARWCFSRAKLPALQGGFLKQCGPGSKSQEFVGENETTYARSGRVNEQFS